MKLSNKKSKLTPTHIKDPEINKAFSQLYKELNEIKESVNNFKLKEEGDEAEGKEGDMRVMKSQTSNSHTLQIRGNEGWLEDKTAKYVSLKPTVDLPSEHKKKTLPKQVGGLLPSPDFISEWHYILRTSLDQSSSGPWGITHPLKVIPNLWNVQFAPDQGSGSHGDIVAHSDITWVTSINNGFGYLSDGGLMVRIQSDIAYFAAGDGRLIHSSDFGIDGTHNHTYPDVGSIRLLLWK